MGPVASRPALDLDAAARFLRALDAVPHQVRTHEPARHARHLAALWGVPLAEAGRATLFGADRGCVLALVPANRKVSAPRFRSLLGAADLCVLRGDRGVGRTGWEDMPGSPGALPALPELFSASCWVDQRIMALPRIVVSLEATRSVALAPADYVRITSAHVARFTGSTRLLEEGGMVDEAEQRV